MTSLKILNHICKRPFPKPFTPAGPRGRTGHVSCRGAVGPAGVWLVLGSWGRGSAEASRPGARGQAWATPAGREPGPILPVRMRHPHPFSAEGEHLGRSPVTPAFLESRCRGRPARGSGRLEAAQAGREVEGNSSQWLALPCPLATEPALRLAETGFPPALRQHPENMRVLPAAKETGPPERIVYKPPGRGSSGTGAAARLARVGRASLGSDTVCACGWWLRP